MRAAVLLGIVLCCWPDLHAAENRALLAAKTQYVRQVEPARAEYIKALDAEMARLAGANDLAGVLRLRTHRGEFLLGLKPADDFGSENSEAISGELTAAATRFGTVLAESRTELEETYDAAIKGALAINDFDGAARMRQELDLLGRGEYAPSVMEVDRQKPYDIRRVVLEHLLTVPLHDMSLPDELSVDVQAQRFRISGTCRTDVHRILGRTCGHFGKVVLLAPPRGRARERHGYLQIGTREREGQYSMIVASGDKIAHVFQLGDVELDTVHEWSVVADRQELTFEVSRNGEVVKSVKVPGNHKTIFGFCATVRYLDTKSWMLVAVD